MIACMTSDYVAATVTVVATVTLVATVMLA